MARNDCVMTYELLFALLGYAFATSITPGPNNMMLMASGANFGLRRSVPHMLGISIGHSVMVFLVGVGLSQLIHQFPAFNTALKILSAAYMLWLAWKIANAAAPVDGKVSGKPFTFLQAAAFQWVNPKAWGMAITATSQYAPDQSIRSYLIVAGIFAATNLPSITVWAYAGQSLRRFLTNPARLRAFNFTMAGLLVLSLIFVLWH
jgi:threonine/homoserine/homoserine lactone efflux protein